MLNKVIRQRVISRNESFRHLYSRRAEAAEALRYVAVAARLQTSLLGSPLALCRRPFRPTLLHL